METLKNRATAAERTSTAMDAQRKAAVADRVALQKEVKVTYYDNSWDKYEYSARQ